MCIRDRFKKVGVLSGGEKSRIALCKILLTKANFIILDEPTNHLDYTSKLILQKALLDFKGTLILVSHDVDFLRPIATKVIDIRKGHLKTYLGGIDYFFSKRDFSSLERDGSIKENKPVVIAVNRKEQKRIEAELRQQKHIATKDLVKEISKWEEKINLKEIEIKNLETMLADPAIYNDGVVAKETTNKFNKAKSELESATKKWEELTEKLLEIESQFT